MITSEKWQQIRRWMDELDIAEADLQEQFILGSGRGGQNLQKTSSCVLLKHLPSGIVIKCQESRLRESNRFFARRRLCEKIDAIQKNEKSKQQQACEKIRRQKKRRSRRSKQKMLDNKKHRGQLKEERKKPDVDG